MKHFLFIILFSTSVFSQNYYNTSGVKQSLFPPKPIFQQRNTNNLIVVESFENTELRNNPQAGDFYLEHVAVSHSFALAEKVKRFGDSAGRFEINKNDPKLYGGHRSEMAQLTSTTLDEGWYGFSQYFPESYTSDTTEEVVGQWHDQPDIGETTARSPSNAIITGNDRLKWMIRWDSTRKKLDNNSEGLLYIDLGRIPKNKWIDWVVHIKYSHTNTGILEVWMDGVKVIDRKNLPNCYNDEKYPYFKFGVYKWEWGKVATQRVIFYDEVKIGDGNSSYEEVKPGI